MPTTLEELVERVKDIGRLRSIGQLLEWDQDTYMPPRGVTARAQQAALIAGLAHEKLTAAETGALLGAVDVNEGDPVRQTIVRETRRSFERASRVPNELVKSIAEASAVAKDAWVRARKEDDFAAFAPHLATLVALKRRLADHVGFQGEPYDALLDEFEPGATVAGLAPLFAELERHTRELLRRIAASPHKPDVGILTRHFPRTQQEKLCRSMAEALGFDFSSGRADVTVHPFCTTIGGSGDVRITTRYHEDFLPAALFGTMHETGHALYELGLPFEHMFTPAAEAVSLGIHESQSRMWENFVGRSRAFWVAHFKELTALFPESLEGVTLEDFYRAINVVRPSFIRVEADELTYNLHIILRMDLERRLLRGDLKPADVPGAWNGRFSQLFGIVPPSDREGCLQDIHWSLGIFGYFPTYTLGNLYAAQFFEQVQRDLPDLPDTLAAGQTRPLLDWLREKIHRHGQRYRAAELIERVTGEPLSVQPFVRYATRKFSEVYAPQAS